MLESRIHCQNMAGFAEPEKKCAGRGFWAIEGYPRAAHPPAIFVFPSQIRYLPAPVSLPQEGGFYAGDPRFSLIRHPRDLIPVPFKFRRVEIFCEMRTNRQVCDGFARCTRQSECATQRGVRGEIFHQKMRFQRFASESLPRNAHYDLVAFASGSTKH